MVTMDSCYFTSKNAKTSHVAFEHEFNQISKAALTEAAIKPQSFKAALLSKLPKNFDIIRFVLQALKLLGQAPFSYDPRKETYYFIWPCLDTAISLGAAAAAIFWLFIYLTHFVLEKFIVFGPGIRHTLTALEQALRSNQALNENKREANIGSFAVLNTSFPLQQLVNLFCGWSCRQKLVQLMNSWVDLRRNLNTFLLKVNDGKVTRENINYYTVIGLGIIYFFTGGIFMSLLAARVPAHPDQGIELTTFAIVFGYIFICETLKDTLIFLTFYELLSNFRQVGDQIRLDMEAGKVSEKRVDTWRGLILLIRKQTEKVSDCMSGPQLFLILQSMLLGTVALFIALVGSHEGSAVGMKEYALGTFIWLLIRLCWKASFAEQITSEEAKIAGQLLERNFRGSVHVETELRDLRNFLLSHPVQINFGNIVVLRKKVYLGVVSQIVTYLIVLIQFYN